MAFLLHSVVVDSVRCSVCLCCIIIVVLDLPDKSCLRIYCDSIVVFSCITIASVGSFHVLYPHENLSGYSACLVFFYLLSMEFGSSNTSRYRRPPSSSEVSRNTSHTSEISWHRRPDANSLSRTPALRTTTGSGQLVANVKHIIIIIGVGLLVVVDSGGRVLPALQYGRQATGCRKRRSIPQ